MANSGTVTPDQVYQEVLSQGGSEIQAQVAAALVSGIESNGELNDQNPSSTASGLFQFLDTTWNNYGGVSHAGNASFQQQVAKYVQETSGNNFQAWAPDLMGTDPNNPANYVAVSAPVPGSPVANKIDQNAVSIGYTPVSDTSTMSATEAAGLQAAVAAGGGPYLSALAAQNSANSSAGSGTTNDSSTVIGGVTYGGNGYTSQQTSALSTVEANLSTYGFTPAQTTALTNWAWTEITNNVDPTQIAIDLQNQPAFTEAFPYFAQVNKALNAQGQAAISPATYQGLQSSYLASAQAGGLPPGMLTGQDIATLISGNVSPTEFSSRVNDAISYVQSNPDVQQQFNDWFGTADGSTAHGPLSLGQMAAVVMNPNVSEPLIKQQLAIAQIGGAATLSGIGSIDQATATQLQQAGISTSQATSAFQNLAPYSALETARPGMGGEAAEGTVTADQLATGQLLGNPAAQRQLQQAVEVAKAPFSGGGGFVTSSKGTVGAGSASSSGAGNT